MSSVDTNGKGEDHVDKPDLSPRPDHVEADAGGIPQQSVVEIRSLVDHARHRKRVKEHLKPGVEKPFSLERHLPSYPDGLEASLEERVWYGSYLDAEVGPDVSLSGAKVSQSPKHQYLLPVFEGSSKDALRFYYPRRPALNPNKISAADSWFAVFTDPSGKKACRKLIVQESEAGNGFAEDPEWMNITSFLQKSYKGVQIFRRAHPDLRKQLGDFGRPALCEGQGKPSSEFVGLTDLQMPITAETKLFLQRQFNWIEQVLKPHKGKEGVFTLVSDQLVLPGECPAEIEYVYALIQKDDYVSCDRVADWDTFPGDADGVVMVRKHDDKLSVACFPYLADRTRLALGGHMFNQGFVEAKKKSGSMRAQLLSDDGETVMNPNLKMFLEQTYPQLASLDIRVLHIFSEELLQSGLVPGGSFQVWALMPDRSLREIPGNAFDQLPFKTEGLVYFEDGQLTMYPNLDFGIHLYKYRRAVEQMFTGSGGSSPEFDGLKRNQVPLRIARECTRLLRYLKLDDETGQEIVSHQRGVLKPGLSLDGVTKVILIDEKGIDTPLTVSTSLTAGSLPTNTKAVCLVREPDGESDVRVIDFYSSISPVFVQAAFEQDADDLKL